MIEIGIPVMSDIINFLMNYSYKLGGFQCASRMRLSDYSVWVTLSS